MVALRHCPYDLSFSIMRVPNASQEQCRDACCHLANVIERYRQDFVFIRNYELSDVVFRQITLAVVCIQSDQQPHLSNLSRLG